MSPSYAASAAQEFDQTGTGYQHPNDTFPMFEEPNLGHPGNTAPSGSLSGGSAMCSVLPRPLGANMAYLPHDFNLHTSAMQPPSVNHGSNPPISSHMIAPQHQWGTGIHFSTSGPSQNNFGASPLFHPTGYTNLVGLADPMQRVHSSSTARNGQSNFPEFETWVVDGGSGAAAQPPTTFGIPLDMQPRADFQTVPLAGEYSQGPITSQNGLHANRDTTAIPPHLIPESVANNGVRTFLTNNGASQIQGTAPMDAPLTHSGLPGSTHTPNKPSLGQGKGTVGVPKWITFIKPRPQDKEKVITLRRDNHLALDIILEHLPRGPPAGCNGIKVPATGSVRNCADTTGKNLLEFRIRLYGATTQQLYELVCASCQKREGKRRGTPGLIDFKTDSDVIEPKDGNIRVEFVFCCYPKDHGKGDKEYLLEVVLYEDESQKHIVAQSRLPFSFNVVPKVPPVQAKRKRQDGDPITHEPRVVRRRVDCVDIPAQIDPPRNEPIHHPALDIDYPDAAEVIQAPEIRTSSSPPLVPPLVPSRSAGSSSAPLDAVKPPNQAVPPPRTEGECTTTLTEVNPESGSITGGATIWLKGLDFPAPFPLFARFGTAVVPTTFSNPFLLACHLPSATAPGVVDVTLSRHPQTNAPEYGTSIAKFHYVADHDQLIPLLLRIHAQGYPELFPALQTLLTALHGNQGNRGLQGGSQGAGPRDDPIETALVDILSCLQTRPNFHEILSTTNDFSQTLAHLSIFYGYPSLLRRLVEWCIDLAISDVNGLTALHCAFMKGDLDSVRILRRGGASETVTDKLGRTPPDLHPEGFGSAIDLDAEVAAGLDTEMCLEENDIDEQMALGEQFNTLDSSDDNDSGHSQSDFGEDASDQDDPESMAADSFTGGDEGGEGGGGGASGSGGGQIASGSKEPAIRVMNQLLLDRTRRRKKHRGPRMLPDTPYDASVSVVSNKLREAEAEAKAVDFLMSGIFPNGKISLTSLTTEMTPQDIDEFQAAPGTLKYQGLLRRDRDHRDKEIIYCRLCPEDSQLDFKDPEGALHHMAKDHFEMAYSCDCGCNEMYRTSADWRRHRKRKGLPQVPAS